MFRLTNVIQDYAWGSRTAIAELQGEASPSSGPQAELWMGAHLSASSRIVNGGGEQSLADAISADPTEMVGQSVTARFGPRLPFLLKVLAAEEPLSLQAHPDPVQAREGYAAEDAAGIAVDARHRNYRDPGHKPELLCALTPFEALCGFRPIDQTIAILAELDVPALESIAATLEARPHADGLREVVCGLLTRPDQAAVVDAVERSCARLMADNGPAAASYRLAVDLAQRYPGDIGVVVSLLLNLVRLEPGQAVFLAAGNLHAYLHGMGVEVMANSDNVLRGGLTSKHVDVPELLRILDFSSGPVPVLTAHATETGEEVFATPVEDFQLSRIALHRGSAVVLASSGPQIVLVVDGEAELSAGTGLLNLARGESAYLRAGERVRLAGEGTVFRVTVSVVP